METFLAILMALGIYLVGPILIGFALVRICIMIDRRTTRTRQAKSLEEAIEELEHVAVEAKSEGHSRTTTR